MCVILELIRPRGITVSRTIDYHYRSCPHSWFGLARWRDEFSATWSRLYCKICNIDAYFDHPYARVWWQSAPDVECRLSSSRTRVFSRVTLPSHVVHNLKRARVIRAARNLSVRPFANYISLTSVSLGVSFVSQIYRKVTSSNFNIVPWKQNSWNYTRRISFPVYPRRQTTTR